MGRTNLILLVFGIVGCVALSLMMKFVVGKAAGHGGGKRVGREVMSVFAPRLDGAPSFTIERRGAEKVGTLTIKPKRGVSSRRLAKTVGRFVWSLRTEKQWFDQVVVVSDTGDGSPRVVIKVKRPFVFAERGLRPVRKKKVRSAPKPKKL